MNKSALIAAIPTSESRSYEWVDWHKSLKKYGKQESRKLFLAAWYKSGTDQANDETLRNYLHKQGIDLEADWKDEILDFASDPGGILSTASGYFRGIKLFVTVILVLLVAFIALVLYNIGKNPNATINTIIGLKTGGVGR
jgi:hypothetical protein